MIWYKRDMKLKQKVRCWKCNGSGQLTVVNGAALRDIRMRRQVTLKAMAADLGFCISYLSEIERGNRRATAKIEKAYLAL